MKNLAFIAIFMMAIALGVNLRPASAHAAPQPPETVEYAPQCELSQQKDCWEATMKALRLFEIVGGVLIGGKTGPLLFADPADLFSLTVRGDITDVWLLAKELGFNAETPGKALKWLENNGATWSRQPNGDFNITIKRDSWAPCPPPPGLSDVGELLPEVMEQIEDVLNGLADFFARWGAIILGGAILLGGARLALRRRTA